MSSCDFVVSCLPYTAETHEMIDDSLFKQMKKTGVFLNIGRGQTIREDHLVRVLQEGQIAGAVLDVFYNEPLSTDSLLWDMKNTVLTPHCADQTTDFHVRTFKVFLQNL